MAAIGRKDKQTIQELDNHMREVRQQFVEQIKCLDTRMENKVNLVNDMQEFLRKRSELEMEYAKNLERLADRFNDRFQKQRNTYGLSRKDRAAPVNLWSKLLKDTKYKAKTSASLGDILSKNIATRFGDLNEDINRISKNVRDTLQILQDEIIGSIHKLHQENTNPEVLKEQSELVQLQNQLALKDYYIRQSEFVFAESKLKDSVSAKQKAEKESPNKKGNEKKMRNIDRIREKRQIRYNDSRIKATKARNEYILTLEATTAALNKYYDYDIADIVSRSDHNYHNSFTCALKAYCGSELQLSKCFITAADSLSRTIGIVDPDNDRLLFLEDNQHAFLPEKKFSYLKHSEDTITSITAVGALKKELEVQQGDLYDKLQMIKTEVAELGDVMVERNNSLNNTYRQYDSEMNAQHNIDLIHPPMPIASQPQQCMVNPQLKITKEDLERGLLLKFKELILSQNLNTTKQAKYDVLTKALGEISEDQLRKQSSLKDGCIPGSPKSSSFSMKGKPIKLFGTTLEHQCQQTGCDIPEIVESCIRFITKFGLEHQGIFRVSGTSQEISDMKKSFEEGRDPLAGLNHWKDINAVAGVFRAYLRELEDPLFPTKYCNDYIMISRLQTVEEQIAETRKIMDACPALNLHVIKHLLKFVNLVASKSDANKMTSHNLAVVFGPTLIRAPANEDLITNQGQLNIFMEFFISSFYNIFPEETKLNEDGTKSMRSDDGDDDDDDEGADNQTDDELASDEENEGDFLEAEALFDYSARSHKEISFKKGDIIQVFSRANKDWWDAQLNGMNGFVPANYVKVASPELERLDISSDDASIGATEVQSKAETSSEEPFLLEEKIISPRSDGGKDTPRTGGSADQRQSPTNVFMSIDPTASSPTLRNALKSSTLNSRTGVALSAPQPFQNRGASLPRFSKSESDSMSTTDSLSSTVSAVREAFGGQRQKLPVMPLGISVSDLRSTQSKLRPGTPEDGNIHPPATFEERPIPLERGGSVKNLSLAFKRPGGSSYRKPTSSTASDDSLTGEETRRMSAGSATDEKERDYRPKPSFPPAVKPKPLVRRESGGPGGNKLGGSAGVSGGSTVEPSGGQSELIASIRAAAAAKVVKDTTSGIKEETNL